MKNVVVLAFVGLFLVGCSGRVQTNPLPDDGKIHLPTGSSFSYQNKISQARKDDLDRFAYRILRQKEILEISDDEEFLETNNNVVITQNFKPQNIKQKLATKKAPKSIWDKGLESNYE